MKKPARLFILAAVLLACGLTGAWTGIRAPQPASSAVPVFLEKFFHKKAAAPPPQTFYAIHDDASFAANTHVVHLRPYSSPPLEFDISLPRNWELTDLTKNQTLPADQSIITNVATMRSEMIGVDHIETTVALATLKHEISARNWLRSYIFSNGYAMQGEVIEEGPRKASAYCSSIADQANIYSYISVQISGDMIFVSRTDLPLNLKDYAGYVQKKLVDSVQVSYLKQDGVESQKIYTLVDAMKFSYPLSWDIEDPDFKDISRLSVRLRTRNMLGATDGFIGFLAVRRASDTSLIKEARLMKKYFSDFLGINITSLVSSGKADTDSRFLFSRYETYAASYKKEGRTDPEVRLVVLGDKTWYIFIYLISPREQDDLNLWGRNTRTLDLIVKSIR